MTRLRDQLDEARRKVDVDYSDITIRELYRMLCEGELNAAPAYQRKFRWTEGAESKLIESVLLGLPIPSIFVATNEDFTWEVVDGLQRLSSIAHFIGDAPAILNKIDKKKPLELVEMGTLNGLEGKSYSTLSEDIQLYFMRRTLRVTALSDKSDLQVRFDLFERLNGGAVSLTPQEVRSCIFRGPFNELLIELAKEKQFREIVKLKANAENDGTREELVLKFFAYLFNRGNFKGWVTKFLNDFMKDARQNFDAAEGRRIFEASVSHLHSSLNGGPFLRTNTKVTPLNQLEAVLVGIAEVIRSGSTPAIPASGWTDDVDLVKASTKATNTVANLTRRIERARELFS